MRPLTIATRKSPLALWQANHVAKLLREQLGGLEVRLLDMSTEGDRFLRAPLSQIGGKGLFVKEIEQAVLERRADLAVHSLKDMTSHLPGGLCLAAVPEREDPRDVFVGPRGSKLLELPIGARVGTSSLRRACQLLERRPDLAIVSVRGNVQTRIRSVVDQGLAGVVLALAGIRRLGLEGEAAEILEPEISLPAVGQGALAIECREDDEEVLQLVRRLEHQPTRIAITAERAFLARLEGGCTVPLAGYAQVLGNDVHLRALVGSPDGARIIRGERRGPCANAAEMGNDLAGEILDRGGAEVLKLFAHNPVVPVS